MPLPRAAAPSPCQVEALAAIWFFEGEGTDDPHMRFRGTPSAVNAALRGALYRSLHEGNDTLSVHVADPAGSELRLAGTIELLVGPPQPFAKIPDELRFPVTGLIAITIAIVSTALLAVSRLLEPLFAPDASAAAGAYGLLNEDNDTGWGDGSELHEQRKAHGAPPLGIQLPERIPLERQRELPQGGAHGGSHGGAQGGALAARASSPPRRDSRDATRSPVPSSPIHALSPDVSPPNFGQPQRPGSPPGKPQRPGALPHALPHPGRLPSPRRDRGTSVLSAEQHGVRQEDRGCHDAAVAYVLSGGT